MVDPGGAALGLIAGSGRLPLEIARAARRRGRRVAAVAFHGLTDPALAADVDAVRWLHPGEVAAALGSLRESGAREAVMAGKVPKTVLYGDPAGLQLEAGARAQLEALMDRRDDTILGLAARTLAAEGIRLLAQAELVPELRAAEGALGRCKPGPVQRGDVAFGWPLARALAGLDVGQTVVVKDGAVLAVEAIEGTDAAIRRGGGIAAGACVVKVAKPQQDPRFDVPVIGLETVQALIEVGASTLAIEAEATLVLDREQLVAAADAHDIAVLGVSGGALPTGYP